MAVNIEKQIRPNTPQIGVRPYGQIHAHSTGNASSTAQNEADYHMRRPIESGFFSHVVGNGRIIQTAPVNRGAYDVGGGWNAWGYAQVELIESHRTQAEFDRDYKLYVELLRQLAKEASLPCTLDSGNTGILTHEYCTYHQPNNKSDHVDPYPYLAKWGISRVQFKKDIENGIKTVSLQNHELSKIEKLIGGIGMFIYWQPQAKGTISDGYGVWGNKRFYLNNDEKVKHFRAMVRNTTGAACREYRWPRGSEQIKTVESYTDLQKTVV